MNHNLTPSAPSRPLSPLEERLSLEGYRSLLADHCELSDRNAALTEFAIAAWESLQEVRRLLDLPTQPLPLAASHACAARPARLPVCGPAVMRAGEGS
jgi:hypothetical protein